MVAGLPDVYPHVTHTHRAAVWVPGLGNASMVSRLPLVAGLPPLIQHVLPPRLHDIYPHRAPDRRHRPARQGLQRPPTEGVLAGRDELGEDVEAGVGGDEQQEEAAAAVPDGQRGAGSGRRGSAPTKGCGEDRKMR